MKTFGSPILVLGMHRSGTSLLTGCLQTAGLHLGPVNNAAPHNKKGNKENETIRDWHESMLARRGFSWKRPPSAGLDLTHEESEDLSNLLKPNKNSTILWGIKDPRLVWFVESWLNLFPNAQLIAVFRHPSLVAQSLAARPGKLHISVEEGLRLWAKTNLRILNLWQQFRFPLLHYTNDRQMNKEFFSPLELFCKKNGLTGTPRAFYESSLAHQSLTPDTISPPVMQIFDQLISKSLSA